MMRRLPAFRKPPRGSAYLRRNRNASVRWSIDREGRGFAKRELSFDPTGVGNPGLPDTCALRVRGDGDGNREQMGIDRCLVAGLFAAPDHDRGTVLIYQAARDDRLVFRRNFGDASDDNEVVGAKVSADGMLNLRVFFPSLKEMREYGLMKQPDGSIRAMYNRSRKGEYTIKHGEFTANGNPTPPQYKCTQQRG